MPVTAAATPTSTPPWNASSTGLPAASSKPASFSSDASKVFDKRSRHHPLAVGAVLDLTWPSISLFDGTEAAVVFYALATNHDIAPPTVSHCTGEKMIGKGNLKHMLCIESSGQSSECYRLGVVILSWQLLGLVPWYFALGLNQNLWCFCLAASEYDILPVPRPPRPHPSVWFVQYSEMLVSSVFAHWDPGGSTLHLVWSDMLQMSCNFTLEPLEECWTPLWVLTSVFKMFCKDDNLQAYHLKVAKLSMYRNKIVVITEGAHLVVVAEAGTGANSLKAPSLNGNLILLIMEVKETSCLPFSDYLDVEQHKQPWPPPLKDSNFLLMTIYQLYFSLWHAFSCDLTYVQLSCSLHKYILLTEIFELCSRSVKLFNGGQIRAHLLFCSSYGCHFCSFRCRMIVCIWSVHTIVEAVWWYIEGVSVTTHGIQMLWVRAGYSKNVLYAIVLHGYRLCANKNQSQQKCNLIATRPDSNRSIHGVALWEDRATYPSVSPILQVPHSSLIQLTDESISAQCIGLGASLISSGGECHGLGHQMGQKRASKWAGTQRGASPVQKGPAWSDGGIERTEPEPVVFNLPSSSQNLLLFLLPTSDPCYFPV